MRGLAGKVHYEFHHAKLTLTFATVTEFVLLFLMQAPTFLGHVQ